MFQLRLFILGAMNSGPLPQWGLKHTRLRFTRPGDLWEANLAGLLVCSMRSYSAVREYPLSIQPCYAGLSKTSHTSTASWLVAQIGGEP